MGGGVISGSTFGSGEGGNVSVNVSGQLTLENGSIYSFADYTGNAGKIAVTAGTLSISDNGEIQASTFGSGNGGTVAVGATGQMAIDGTAATFLTGVAAQAERAKG